MVETATRDERIFRERLAGAKLADIALAVDLTSEGVRFAFNREANRHLRLLVKKVHEAEADGDVLWLNVPASPVEATRDALRYLDFILTHLPRYGCAPVLEFRSFSDGLLVGIEDDHFVKEDHLKEGQSS